MKRYLMILLGVSLCTGACAPVAVQGPPPPAAAVAVEVGDQVSPSRAAVLNPTSVERRPMSNGPTDDKALSKGKPTATRRADHAHGEVMPIGEQGIGAQIETFRTRRAAKTMEYWIKNL